MMTKKNKSSRSELPLLFAHIKGIWFKPVIELKKISEYNDFQKYLKWILFYLISLEVFNVLVFYIIPPVVTIADIALSPKFINFQNYSKILSLILGPVMFFAGGFITNWLCQKAKAKNKLNTILINTAILGLATNIPLYLYSIIFGKMNNPFLTVIYYVLSFWFYYLSVSNISIIYSISKKLALGIYLLSMICGMVISFIAMSLLLTIS